MISVNETSIGTKKEKTIHQYIKTYISNNEENHEVKIGRNIVDVYDNSHIYEVQTQAFEKLNKKLDVLLKEYKVTIVYPVCVRKEIYRISDDGQVLYKRKSPKSILPCALANELYKIPKFLDRDYPFINNLSFQIFLLDVDEYQKTRINRYKQERTTRIDQYPNEIIDIIYINELSDFSKILPNIEGEFTSNDFRKVSRLPARKASCALIAFRRLGLITLYRKEKNKNIYIINKD